MNYIETENLILRDWREEDIEELSRLNSDDRVMKYFLNKLTHEETVDFYHYIQQEFADCGYGLYAVEEQTTHLFVGLVGLHNVKFNADFVPAVEIGWRLLPEFWGKGYASEAAAACLAYAKEKLNLKEIYSFTSLPNKRSERVMEKIGMTRMKEFDHPLVDSNHHLCRHVLYRITFTSASDE